MSAVWETQLIVELLNPRSGTALRLLQGFRHNRSYGQRLLQKLAELPLRPDGVGCGKSLPCAQSGKVREGRRILPKQTVLLRPLMQQTFESGQLRSPLLSAFKCFISQGYRNRMVRNGDSRRVFLACSAERKCEVRRAASET